MRNHKEDLVYFVLLHTEWDQQEVLCSLVKPSDFWRPYRNVEGL